VSHNSTQHRRRARRAAAAPVLALVAAVVVGCTTETGGGSASTAGNDEPTTVQFVNPLPHYPAWRTTGDCMADQAKERGVALKESGPTGQAIDTGVMVQQVQQAVANRVSAVITMPTSEGFGPMLKQAQSKGIVTGTYYGPVGPDSGADVNAGPDWATIGEQVIGGISALPGQHVVGLVAAAETGLGKSWLDGIKAAAERADNVTIVGEVYTEDDAAQALPQVNALLTAHPDITDIATHMGTVTPGAVAAIKAKNLTGRTFLTAVGHDNGGTEAIAEGTANLMLLQDVCGMGKAMVNGVVDVAEGKDPQPIPVDTIVVGRDEVQGYLDRGWV
jgi:ABC-type sugar transport system substrate-binding protein